MQKNKTNKPNANEMINNKYKKHLKKTSKKQTINKKQKYII